MACQRSIEIFATWKEVYGDDIHWQAIGYSFPVYTAAYERILTDLLKIQQHLGLNIQWLGPAQYKALNPEINMENLRGSTYSPGDGFASPLLFIESAYFKAVACGAQFKFKEKLIGFTIAKNRIDTVKTDKGVYHSANVLNAAGAQAGDVSEMAGIAISVHPKSVEAAITEPVKPFMGPVVADIANEPDARNFTFYQTSTGQVLLSLDPNPAAWGLDSRATSRFLPVVAQKAIRLMPIVANLKVRRTWRGLSPTTPDGYPLVGKMKELDNFYQAVGMGGQGFMLGPGIAEVVCRLVTGDEHPDDDIILKSFTPYRNFEIEETL